MFAERIEILEVELNTVCNARCPACFRQDNGGALSGSFPKNAHLSLNLFEKALRDPMLDCLKEVLMCGNYGDPMASPHVLSYLDVVDRCRPSVGIFLHTNGSLGADSTWRELGARLSGRGRFVKFSIDGLQDTNSIYRRGIQWERVMENARCFIESGGRAVWKFIIFKHNQHQVEEARALATRMGFARFETVANYAPHLEPFRAEDAPKRASPAGEALSYVPSFAPVECVAKKERSLYLDCQGGIWPCCWMAGWTFSANDARRKFQEEFSARIANGMGNFNSLAGFSLTGILSHPWFAAGLENSWRLAGEQSDRHPVCTETCLAPCKPAL